MDKPTVEAINDLQFPELLPGYYWRVVKDRESFLADWDTFQVQIRRRRRGWWDFEEDYTRFHLTDARKKLEQAGYGDEDSEESIPDDEADRWRMYVMKIAEKMHEQFVSRHLIPVKYQKMVAVMSAIDNDLNAGQTK